MHIRLAAPWYLLLVIPALSACGGDPISDLRSAESITLFSIVSSPPPGVVLPTIGERFRGYAVLGKMDISNAEAKKSIVDALHQAILPGDEPRPRCFEPRHGIRVKQLGMSTDLLICFECRKIQTFGLLSFIPFIYSEISVEAKPQKVLNAHLRKVGIPLDPSMKGDI